MTPERQINDVQVPQSYLNDPVNDKDHTNNDMSTFRKADTQVKSENNSCKEKTDLKSMISENQLDCVDSSLGDSSVDSSDLWSQMAKMSQVEVKINMDEPEAGHKENSNKNKNSDKSGLDCNEKLDEESRKYHGNSVSSASVLEQRTSRGSDSQLEKKNLTALNRTVPKRCQAENNGSYSQVSVLDDLFGISGVQNKTKRKPAPSKGRAAKDLNTHKVKVEKSDVHKRENRPKKFEAVSSTDSDSEVHLEASTLKDDNYDCFDDPRKWKKRRRKPESTEMSAVDKIISDSEADFNKLFASGKLKRTDGTGVKIKKSSPVKTSDRSPSLFSY